MTSAQLNLLAKARQSLSAAKLMLDGEYPDYAASRAYYTMFYIAKAFLEDKGLSFSKSGVISAFNQKFARTGRVPVKFHQYLIRAQELRNAGDYGELDGEHPDFVNFPINDIILHFLNQRLTQKLLWKQLLIFSMI